MTLMLENPFTRATGRDFPHQNHYALCHINNRYINSYIFLMLFETRLTNSTTLLLQECLKRPFCEILVIKVLRTFTVLKRGLLMGRTCMGWNYTWTALDELVLSDPDGSSWPHATSVITQGIFNNSFFKVKLEKLMLFLLLTGRYKPLD